MRYEEVKLTESQETLIKNRKKGMQLKHGNYVIEVIDNTITRLKAHAARFNDRTLGDNWIDSNLRLLDSVFEEARSRGISILPSSMLTKNQAAPSMVQLYLSSGIVLDAERSLTPKDMKELAWRVMEYFKSRYYLENSHDDICKIFLHCVTFDLDHRDPAYPLALVPMVNVDHFR